MVIYDRSKHEYFLAESAELKEFQQELEISVLPQHIQADLLSKGYYRQHEDHQCCSTDFYS